MLTLNTTNQFKRDIKLIVKRGYNLELLEDVIEKLLKEESLPVKYFDHALTGNYIGFRECHIRPDWLLVYAIDRDKLVLTASRTGTHSDLF